MSSALTGSAALAAFAAQLQAKDIPAEVMRKTEDLFGRLVWLSRGRQGRRAVEITDCP